MFTSQLTFYACLALNYATFGLLLLKLVGNCDHAMRLAKKR